MSDDELVQLIKQHKDEAVTASDIAEDAPIGQAGVLSRLNQMEADGIVTKKEVGSRAVVWWVERN